MEKAVKTTNHLLIKLVAILAVCVMLLVGIALFRTSGTATATEPPLADQTITLSDSTVNRGADFDVNISIGSNSTGIQAIRLLVTFDNTVMTLNGVTAVNPAENEDWTSDFNAAGEDAGGGYASYGKAKPFVLLWVSSAKKFGEGVIATLHFTSHSSAAAAQYQIGVQVDTNSTLLALGEKCNLNVSGGTITMLPGVYSIFLYDDNGNEYVFLESNTNQEDVTIEKALEERGGLAPGRESTSKYTYTFRGWREVQAGNHTIYEPTYTATPVPYDITFHKGILFENDETITYTGENTSSNTVTIPYAKIINFDAEIPERFDDHYSFLGWYTDEACTTPVNFVTMPDSNVNVYGYFKLNVDEPSVTTTALTVTTAFEGEYLLATISVENNFGINSIRFAPSFPSTKLDFVGFLYEQDSPFFGSFDPVFPEINDAIKEGSNVVDTWQTLGEGESIVGKSFLFLNANANVFATGKLITLKFKIKEGVAVDEKLSVTIGNRDVTRYDANGGIYYANAIVNDATVRVIRVVKPTAYDAKEYYYDFGNDVSYKFENNGGENYYELSGNVEKVVGEYTVTATLKEIDNTLVTWADGTTAALAFDFEILPFVVTKPIAADVEYVYSGDKQYFAFTQESSVHSAYYSVSGGEQIAAGTYDVTVALNDTDNFVWVGGSTAPLGGDDYIFVIKRIKVVKPTAYTAQEKAYAFNPGTAVPYNYNNAGVPITYQFKSEDNQSKTRYSVSGNVESTVGNYTVTVALSDKNNTEWADENETVDVGDLMFDFVIGKYAIPTPNVAGKAYTGALQTAEITLPVNSPYTVTANEGGVDKGDYDVVFTIGEEFYANYKWADSETNSVTAVFHISESVNEWVLAPYANSKTYDGTSVSVGASPKYGTVVIEYRLQSETDDDYYIPTDEKPAPVDAGAYFAKFYVTGNATYDTISEIVPFVIDKVRLNAPIPYTAEEKQYTYTGSPVNYLFKQAGNSEAYDVTGGVETHAGNYTVIVSIKEENKANYVWKGETPAEDSAEDLVYSFVIGKAQLPVPVPAERTYVYNGTEQTFEFSSVEYSDRYTISGNKYTAAGRYTVTVKIENKSDYEWVGGTTDDKTYEFAIRYASLTDLTDDETFSMTLSTAAGFDADSIFTLTKVDVDAAALLAEIAAATKKGALGQITDEDAVNRVNNKCLIGYLLPNLAPVVGAGEYRTEITIPVAREGIVVLRIVGETVEVFDVTTVGRTISFVADHVTPYVILADHSCTLEIVNEAFLKSAATCETAAVYYKSCSCGAIGEETFVSGDPLGHDYDFDNISWVFSSDHLSATATVVCLRDQAHVRTFPTTVEIVDRVVPGIETSGRVVRRASFTYNDQTYYSDPDIEVLPANGHVFTENLPNWIWKTADYKYNAKAYFVCDCGEKTVAVDAVVTSEVGTSKITYTAEVQFQGTTYRDVKEIDRPVVVFDYNDGETLEVSAIMLPGDTVAFFDAARDGYTFIGWRDATGALVVKDNEGKYLDYKIGFERLVFTAEWRAHAIVAVSVVDSDGEIVSNATVSLYNGDIEITTVHTSATGTVTFPKVPYGNYKLVVRCPYLDDSEIVRSSYLDVAESEVTTTVVLPKTKFDTIVEGVGSAEGLEGAIPESEKNAISEGMGAGTINSIVITQHRVSDVDDEIKEEIVEKMRRDEEYRRGEIVDFYDITIVKTTTIRNSLGVQFVQREDIKVAERFQTNIFPITSGLLQEILVVGGNADNIFVYKRHTYDTGVVVIYPLPKVAEADGENANYECFFIKRVAGEEYIAIRQREYSVLAFGASPDPILLTNEITELTIADRTFGDQAVQPLVHARYGESSAVISYSTAPDGDFTSEIPTAAGTYYVKAFVPATNVYAAAEKVVSFTIRKKMISRPAADPTEFIYNGAAQTYMIAANAAYIVTGNVQTNAGTYVVTVTLADSANTVWDSGLESPLTYEFVIAKQKIADTGNIKFEGKKFWFNGKKHSIKISGDLPEGIEVVYSGNGESDLGKFIVTATFVSVNPNYDVSAPMTAVMTIRLNWIPILILIILALLILIVVIVIVEKMLKKEKEEGQTPPSDDAGGGTSDATDSSQQNATEEGQNND